MKGYLRITVAALFAVTVLMASLGFAGIPLDRWYKFMWKWLVTAILVGAVFIMIGVAINYGPF